MFFKAPYECGRDFRVKLDKDFIGKGALLQQREEKIRKRFVQFLLENHDLYRDVRKIYTNYRGCFEYRLFHFSLGHGVESLFTEMVNFVDISHLLLMDLALENR